LARPKPRTPAFLLEDEKLPTTASVEAEAGFGYLLKMALTVPAVSSFAKESFILPSSALFPFFTAIPC
jgi:hypothetical protein